MKKTNFKEGRKLEVQNPDDKITIAYNIDLDHDDTSQKV